MTGRILSLLLLFIIGCSIPKLKDRNTREAKRYIEDRELTITSDTFEDPWIRQAKNKRSSILGDSQTRFRVHLALYEAFFPRELIDKHKGSEDYYRLMQIKLWEKIHNSPVHLSILDVLSNLRILSSNLLLELYHAHPRLGKGVSPYDYLKFFEEKIEGFSNTKIPVAFNNLKLKYRDKFLVMLMSSKYPIYRSLAANIRNFYIDYIYNLPIVRNKLGLGKTYIQKFDEDLPEFKVTDLFLDKPTGKIRGNVDYVIVGGSISSFYLAHELVKKGNHVVLLGEDEIDFRSWKTIDGPSGVGIQLRRPEGIYRPLGADLDHAEIKKVVDRWRFLGHKGLPDPKEIPKYVHDALEFLEFTPYQKENFREISSPFFRAGMTSKEVHPGHYSWTKLRNDSEGSEYQIGAKRIYSKFEYLKGKFTYIPRVELKRLVFEGDRSYKKVIGVEFFLRKIDKKKKKLEDIYKVSLPVKRRLKLFGKHVVLNLRADHAVTFFKKTGFQNPQIGTNLQLFPHVNVYGVYSSKMGQVYDPEIFSYVRGKARYPGDILPDDIFYSHYRNFDLGEFVLQEVQPLPKKRMKQWRHYYPLRVGVLPQLQNRVLLTKRDNEYFYDFDMSETEKARLRFGIIEAGKLLLSIGANSILLPSLESNETKTQFLYHRVENKDELEKMVGSMKFESYRTQLFSHILAGGMPFGPDETKHVVAENYEIYGVKDLYIIGDSILPGVLPFGLELANMIVAKKLSEQL